MKEIHGVMFNGDASQLLELLIVRMTQRFPHALPYGDTNGRTRNDVRFAYRPRVFGRHAAWGIILVVHADDEGRAYVRRPRSPGAEVWLVPLTEEVFEEMFAAAEQRYVHFSEKKMPVVRVSRGDKRVLPGGQFESKRSKH